MINRNDFEDVTDSGCLSVKVHIQDKEKEEEDKEKEKMEEEEEQSRRQHPHTLHLTQRVSQPGKRIGLRGAIMMSLQQYRLYFKFPHVSHLPLEDCNFVEENFVVFYHF